jgi:hypothetical protein
MKEARTTLQKRQIYTFWATIYIKIYTVKFNNEYQELIHKLECKIN